jgi:hypothetical protein
MNHGHDKLASWGVEDNQLAMEYVEDFYQKPDA